MPVVVPAQRPGFSPDDIAMFSDIFRERSAAFRWPHCEIETRDDGSSEKIEFVNPDDWEWLTLSRTIGGSYQAEDLDGIALVDTNTFSDLLARLGMMQA